MYRLCTTTSRNSSNPTKCRSFFSLEKQLWCKEIKFWTFFQPFQVVGGRDAASKDFLPFSISFPKSKTRDDIVDLGQRLRTDSETLWNQIFTGQGITNPKKYHTNPLHESPEQNWHGIYWNQVEHCLIKASDVFPFPSLPMVARRCIGRVESGMVGFGQWPNWKMWIARKVGRLH